jgi:hypothetical protein
MNVDHIVGTMTLNTIVAFVILLVALLTSFTVMWRKEHLWNFSVLPRVYVSNLVRCYLRFSLSEEHVVGPSMSVCRVLYSIVTTVTLDRIFK